MAETQASSPWRVAGTISRQEIRTSLASPWMQFAAGATLLYTVLFLGGIYSASQGARGNPHSMSTFVSFMDQIRWGSLGVAAVLAGPSLLADVESDALELYLSRPLSYPTYLSGKIGAVLSGTALTLWIPALVYFALSFVLFENQPSAWNWLPLTSLAYSLLWSIPIAGLGLGLSCVARSSRAASLWLFGGIAALDVLVADLLTSITAAEALSVLSPFAALSRQNAWLFDVAAEASFPPLWGLISLGVATAIGWGLLVTNHPMVRGGESS